MAAPPPTARVMLGWDPSPSPNVAGYRVYVGPGSGNYTNVLDVGNVTVATVSNLVVGTTYFFAVSAYDIVGLESALSEEISYTVSLPEPPRLELSMNSRNQAVVTGTGPAGYVYDLLVTSDLEHWISLTNITMDAKGTCEFTDFTVNASMAPSRYYRLERRSP